MKTCSQCSTDKPLVNFYFVKRTGGHTSACKECVRSNSQAWRDNNPGRNYEAVRDWRMRKTFGITVEIYEEMLAGQGGVCKLCGSPPPTGRNKLLAVDHCHQTGRVRGLLCSPCNKGIGAFGDGTDTILAAIAYLEENHGDH